MIHDADRARLTYEANRKDALTAYLLWATLGMFGVHRFYLGRPGSGSAQAALAVGGFLTLLLSIGLVMWVALGVWTVVDAALIPGMVREHNLALLDRS